jgi:hypothetical protein
VVLHIIAFEHVVIYTFRPYTLHRVKVVWFLGEVAQASTVLQPKGWLANIAKYRYKRLAGRLGDAHAKSSGLWDVTRIEPRVATDSVHSLRLS